MTALWWALGAWIATSGPLAVLAGRFIRHGGAR